MTRADPVVAASQRIIERGSKSFAAAAKLFDRRTREHAFMLYAWCRHCDDRIDGQELGFGHEPVTAADRAARLDRLTRETRAAMAGDPTDDPVFEAFQRVYFRCAIPERYPLELLEGFAMDVAGHRYKTLDDTLRYCYHVAGTVGGMMAAIMGVTDQPTQSRAVDLGIAFQLTNIARDVMDDAANGRIYLPENWLAAAGVPADPRRFADHTPGLSQVAVKLLDAAEPYYDSARHGISRLPFRCAWAVSAALAVYRDIGRLVRDRGSAAWGARISVSSTRKLGLLASGGSSAAAAVTVRRRRPAPPRTGLWQVEPREASGDR